MMLHQVCEALQKAALDPRIKGLAIEIGPLAVGYAKLQELRRWVMWGPLNWVSVTAFCDCMGGSWVQLTDLQLSALCGRICHAWCSQAS